MNFLNNLQQWIALAFFTYISLTNACTPRNQESSDSQFTKYATCSVQGSIHGSVFMREGVSGTEFRVKLAGLPKGGGSHGFHVHQYGNLFTKNKEEMCKAASGHYNPEKKEHGAPTDAERHVGDLGNVCADANGEVDEVFVDQMALLSGNFSILAKGIVVHAGADDLTSQPTGAAGSRVGCCVIGEAEEWAKEQVAVGYQYQYISATPRVQIPLLLIFLPLAVVLKLF